MLTAKSTAYAHTIVVRVVMLFSVAPSLCAGRAPTGETSPWPVNVRRCHHSLSFPRRTRRRKSPGGRPGKKSLPFNVWTTNPRFGYCPRRSRPHQQRHLPRPGHAVGPNRATCCLPSPRAAGWPPWPTVWWMLRWMPGCARFQRRSTSMAMTPGDCTPERRAMDIHCLHGSTGITGGYKPTASSMSLRDVCC